MDKNSKSVTSLFIILALLALAALALSVANKQGTRSQDKLAPGLAEQLGQMTAIKLTGGGDALIADIRNNNDTWVVANAGNYPVDIGKLREFIQSLAAANIIETTTALPENYARLGVSDISSNDATGIQIAIDSTANPLQLILGNSSSGNTTFVRHAGEAQSWRVNGSLQPGRSITDWVNRAVINIPAVAILNVTITHADGEIVAIDKSGTGYILANQPADQPLQRPGLLNNIAGVLDNVELEDVRSVATLHSEPVEMLTNIKAQAANGLLITIDAVSQDDVVWLSFGADFDASLAITPDTDEPTSATTDAASTPADALNQRLSGWAYRIPDYKSDWLLKRNADLLQNDES